MSIYKFFIKYEIVSEMIVTVYMPVTNVREFFLQNLMIHLMSNFCRSDY